jgi:hypothetical protein
MVQPIEFKVGTYAQSAHWLARAELSLQHSVALIGPIQLRNRVFRTSHPFVHHLVHAEHAGQPLLRGNE